MDNLNFVVFDGLNLEKYEICQTDEKNLIEDAVKKIGGANGYSMGTSSWMNRFEIMEYKGIGIIIIPSTIPSYNDVVKATVGKYAIYRTDGNRLYPFDEESISYFINNLPAKFDKKERDLKNKETDEQYRKVFIRDSFRMPLFLSSDDTVNILRFLILNDEETLFHRLVTAGMAQNDDEIQSVYKKIVNDERIGKISIPCEKFGIEIINFFMADIHHASLGVSLEESVAIYHSLCDKNSWLREAFLGISEKESRDMYREFLKKDLLNFVKKP